MGMMEAGLRKLLETLCATGTPETPKPAGRKSSGGGPLALALEPRVLFDAAGVATAAQVAHQPAGQPAAQAADPIAKALADHVLPADPTASAPAPTQVRAADPSQNGGKMEVVFIETSVADYQKLADGVRAGVEVDIIDGGQGGLAQMAKWAESHSGYDAIHVLSHSGEATLYLGTDIVTDSSLSDTTVQVELAEIGHALNAGGDLLLYGCDIAKGSDGQAFIHDISTVTGADVAASLDLTGVARVGGNWVLESATGTIETTPLAIYGYQSVLSVTGTDVSLSPTTNVADAWATVATGAGLMTPLDLIAL